MNHSESASPTPEPASTPIDAAQGGLTRRQLGIAAAWSAPIIAVAVTAPLASASTGNPDNTLQISSSSQISFDPDNEQNASAIGELGGGATLVNHGIPGTIDLAQATYTLNGPIENTSFRHNGVLLANGGTLSEDGLVWLIAIAGNVIQLTLSSGTVEVDGGGSATPIPVPRIRFETTLTEPATSLNPVSAQILFEVMDSTQSGPTVGGSFTKYPGGIGNP